MKRRKKPRNPMIVTGHESHFDAVQVVMAALTWAEAGPAEAVQATEAILSLNKDKAVMALWVTLNTVLSGFDSDEDRATAVRIVAETMAKNEAIITAGLEIPLS